MGAPSVTFFVLLLSCLEKTALSSRLYARNPFFENLNLSSNSLSEIQPGSSAPPPQIIVLPPGSEPTNFDYQNLGNEQNPPRPIVISGYHYYPPYAQDYPSFYQPQPQIHPGIIQKPLQQEFVNEYPSRVNSGQINCHPSATLNVVSKPSSYGIEQHEQQQQVQQQLEIQQQQLLQQQQEQQIQQQLLQQQYPQQQVVQQQPAVQTQKLPTPHNSLRAFCATPRGQYPTNECNKYVNCWDDSVVEQYCPKGLVFNPKGYCDFSFNVECGRKPIVDVPLSTPIEVVVQQPNQQQQQQQQQPTIIPISATWTPTTNPPPLQSLPIVSQPIQEPVVAEITTSTLPPVDPKLGAKCQKSRGQFPTDSCNKYINCWDGNAIEEECPEGLLFSTKGYCDYAFNVDCLGRTHSGVIKPVQPFYQPNQIHQVQPQENYGQSNPFLQTHLQGQTNQQVAQSHNFTQINQASNTNQVQSQQAGHYGSNPFLQSHLQGQSNNNQQVQSTQLNQSNQVLQSTNLNQASSTNQIQAQQGGHYGSNPFLQSNNQQIQSTSQNAQSSQNNLTQNNQSALNNFLQTNPFLQTHFHGQSNKNSLLTQLESHELQGYNKQSIDRTTNNLSQLDKQKNPSTIQHQTNNLAQSNNQQNHSSQTENKVQSNYQQSLQQHLQTTQTQSSQSNFNILSNHLIDQHQFLQPQSQYIVQPLNQYSPSYLALTNQPVQNYHLQSNYQSSQNAEINYTGTINGGIKECECLIDSGTFRNKNNCSQFYTCIDNKVVSKYECPAGLSFNDVIGVCDYSYRVDCTHEPYVYIPLKSNTFHKLPNEILQKVPAGLIDAKAGCNLGSVFKLNNECSVAAICKTGVVEIVVCPTGFAYDSPSDKCLVPYLARC